MEVILLERVAKLGQMGDVVRVKDGFARNFLLPKGKALRATEENRSRFENMKVDLEARNLEQKGEAEKVAQKLDGQSFTVLRQAAEGGQLYGSVSPRDLADLVSEKGFAISRAQIALNTPDQDHRTAQGAGLAASRSRGDDQRHGRAQCRRGGADRPRRGHHHRPRRSRRSRRAGAGGGGGFFEPEVVEARRSQEAAAAAGSSAEAESEK